MSDIRLLISTPSGPFAIESRGRNWYGTFGYEKEVNGDWQFDAQCGPFDAPHVAAIAIAEAASELLTLEEGTIFRLQSAASRLAKEHQKLRKKNRPKARMF